MKHAATVSRRARFSAVVAPREQHAAPLLYYLARWRCGLAAQGRAQQKAMPVIGFLSAGSLSEAAARLPAFRQGLSETGYLEGENVAIKYRWAEGHYDRLPALAADLVSRKVDVIVTPAIPAARAAKNATSMTPIVFTAVND